MSIRKVYVSHMKKTLRPYQLDGIQFIRESMLKHRSVLLVSPTGSGKTLLFCEVMSNALARKKTALLVVNARQLVDQASKRLNEHGVAHGVLMSNDKRIDHLAAVQVCSIQTLSRRKKCPPADLIVVDECFTPDMEILTEHGFIRFDCLKRTSLVAQFNQTSKAISFCKPTDYIEREVIDHPMITITSDKKIDVTTTENHDFIFYRGLSGKQEKRKIKDVKFGGDDIKIYKAGYASGTDNILTHAEKMLIAFQADGHDQSPHKMHFTFSKQRKIDDFLSLVEAGKFEYHEIKGTKEHGNTQEKRRFSVAWTASKSKILFDHFKLANLSIEKCREIIEYMVLWDGSRISDVTYYYSSAVKDNTDFFQAIATLAGYTSNLTLQHDNRSDNFSTMHRLFIRKMTDHVSSQQMIKKEHKYTGRVFCVSVPTGNIIVRRNGKVIAIGNCHNATAETYLWLFAQYPDAYILGVTATPFVKRGLGTVFSDFIELITMKDLTAQGFLCPLRYYAAPQPDLSGVKVQSTGDYNVSELFNAVNKSELYGDIIENYTALAPGKRALAFGVNIEHSKNLATIFNDAGIPAVHIDATTSLEERNLQIARLERDEIKVITSVGTFITGVDIPSLEALIVARPTMSLNLHIQMIGRLTRTFPGKSYGIVIDHTGNTLKHNKADAYREISLAPRPKKEPETALVTCSGCYSIFCPLENYQESLILPAETLDDPPGNHRTKRNYACPVCFLDNTPPPRAETEGIKTMSGKLSELRDFDIPERISFWRDRFEKSRTTKLTIMGEPFKKSWTYHKLVEKFGYDEIMKYYAKELRIFKVKRR